MAFPEGLIPSMESIKLNIIGETPNRGVTADHDIPAGSYFLFEESKPYSYCLNVDQWKKRCQFCLCQPDSPKRCSRCKCVLYCSEICQRQHWRVHKGECGFIKRTLGDVHHSNFKDADVLRDCLMLARVCMIDQFKIDVNHLCRGKLTPSSYKELKNLAKACKAVIPAIREELTDALVNILNLFQTNSFCILGELLQSIGHGVFPTSALINHSCQPNSALLHLLSPGSLPRQHFISLETIPAGTQLTHCYVEQLMPRDLRQEYLNKHYGFLCECSRCQSPPQVDLNYVRFSPKDLEGKSIKQMETILRDTPHWVLRAAQYQVFLQLMLSNNDSPWVIDEQVELLHKVMDYDRLIYSEHHPMFVMSHKILGYLLDCQQSLSQ